MLASGRVADDAGVAAASKTATPATTTAMRMMTQPPLKQNPVAHATIGVSPEQALTPARPLDGNLAIDHDGLDAQRHHRRHDARIPLGPIVTAARPQDHALAFAARDQVHTIRRSSSDGASASAVLGLIERMDRVGQDFHIALSRSVVVICHVIAKGE